MAARVRGCLADGTHILEYIIFQKGKLYPFLYTSIPLPAFVVIVDFLFACLEVPAKHADPYLSLHHWSSGTHKGFFVITLPRTFMTAYIRSSPPYVFLAKLT